MTAKVNISFRCQPEQKEELEKRAKKEDRDPSYIMLKLLKRFLARKPKK